MWHRIYALKVAGIAFMRIYSYAIRIRPKVKVGDTLRINLDFNHVDRFEEGKNETIRMP